MRVSSADIERCLYRLEHEALSVQEREALLLMLRQFVQTADEEALLGLELGGLIALGAAQAPLTSDEADVIFARAVSARPQPQRRGARALVSAWFKGPRYKRMMSVAIALLAVCALWFWWRAEPPVDPTIKAAQAKIALMLQVFEGDGEGAQAALRGLGEGARVAQDKQLLFRYRLDQPAWIALSVHVEGAPPELLWQSDGLHDAGEFELGAHGQALAMPLGGYPRGELRVVLWASRGPQSWAQVVRGRACTACSSEQFVLYIGP